MSLKFPQRYYFVFMMVFHLILIVHSVTGLVFNFLSIFYRSRMNLTWAEESIRQQKANSPVSQLYDFHFNK